MLSESTQMILHYVIHMHTLIYVTTLTYMHLTQVILLLYATLKYV